MQVEEIKPCPACGSTRIDTRYGEEYHCWELDCRFAARRDVWDRLAHAAELARAVEWLSANTVHITANVIGGEAQPLVWLVQSQHGKARAEHLTAALIALAKKVQE